MRLSTGSLIYLQKLENSLDDYFVGWHSSFIPSLFPLQSHVT